MGYKVELGPFRWKLNTDWRADFHLTESWEKRGFDLHSRDLHNAESRGRALRTWSFGGWGQRNPQKRIASKMECTGSSVLEDYKVTSADTGRGVLGPTRAASLPRWVGSGPTTCPLLLLDSRGIRLNTFKNHRPHSQSPQLWKGREDTGRQNWQAAGR